MIETGHDTRALRVSEIFLPDPTRPVNFSCLPDPRVYPWGRDWPMTMTENSVFYFELKLSRNESQLQFMNIPWKLKSTFFALYELYLIQHKIEYIGGGLHVYT